MHIPDLSLEHKLLQFRQGMVKKGWARFTALELGQIKAHAYHGFTASKIAPLVRKSDGESPSVQGVADALVKMKATPGWRGE